MIYNPEYGAQTKTHDVATLGGDNAIWDKEHKVMSLDVATLDGDKCNTIRRTERKVMTHDAANLM